MDIDYEQIESLGVDPVAGGEPQGENIQGESDYDWVERGFKWLTSLERTVEGGVQAIGEGELPTWETLIENSVKILRDRSKHIRIASYLAMGLFEEKGIRGLSAGLKMIDNLMENFWETMYPPNRPKLLKARASCLEFLATYIAGESSEPGAKLAFEANRVLDEWRKFAATRPARNKFDEAYENLQGDLEAIEASRKTMDSLKERVYTLFPSDKVPSIISLSETFKTLRMHYSEEVKKHKKAEPAEAPAPGAAPQAAAAPGAPPAAAPAVSGSAESVEEIHKFFKKAAPVLREADPANPAAYRLLRIGNWGGIENSPPIKEGSQTLVPPGPVSGAVETFQGVEQSGNWLSLLNQSEGMFANAPLWLDLQYYVHRALKGMGPAYEGAARAVADETGVLVKRLPGIESLEFSDGTPFASDDTRQWLDTDVLSAAAGGGSGGGGAPAAAGGGGEDSSELNEALAEAKELAVGGKGKLAQAMELLQTRALRRGSLREQFQWRTSLAHFTLESKKPHLARPLLEALLGEIERLGLEAWEPGLCLPVLYDLYKILKSDKNRKEAAESIFRRLCAVNMGAALHLEK